jgi:DNA polymerase-3 subunit delta
MSYQSILQDVKAGKFAPVYFLHGPEPYFIDVVCDAIEAHALAEHERAFNQTILYGRDADHLTIVDAARRFPMMAERQLVVVKEAQDMKDLKDLQTYVEKPAPTTVLVLCHKHKNYNLNSGFGKAVKAGAVVLESKALYDNEVPEWIGGYLRDKKLKIEPAAAALIGEYLGTDLSKIANELDKLALNVPGGATVTDKEVEQNIGISRDYNVFELQKALGQRDALKVGRIVNYFAANPKNGPMPVVVASLYGYFSKIFMLSEMSQAPEKEVLEALSLRSSYFLKDYRAALRQYPRSKSEAVMAILREYDLKSKGVDYNATGKPEGELLREMTWRILHL